jgi:hypothetical protein
MTVDGKLVVNISPQNDAAQVYVMTTENTGEIYPLANFLGADRVKVEHKFAERNSSLWINNVNFPLSMAKGYEVHSADPVKGWKVSIVNGTPWWSKFHSGPFGLGDIYREASNLTRGVVEVVLFDSNPDFEKGWLEQYGE